MNLSLHQTENLEFRMTKDSPWHSLECVCYLKKPWCDASCHDDPIAWREVEVYLQDDSTWEWEDEENFEPLKKSPKKSWQ